MRNLMQKTSVTALLALAVLAPWSSAKTTVDQLKFLQPGSVEYVKILPPAADLKSPEMKQEFETLLRVQQNRSAEEVERAKSEITLTVAAFAPVLGPDFKIDSLPKTAALFKQLDLESKFFTGPAKDFYNRLRPTFVDSRIQSAVETEQEPAYPSGHATRGMLFALTLAEIEPQKRGAILARGVEIGWDRVILGVHYPSDVAAGRAMGMALFAQLQKSAAFKTALADAKAEVGSVASAAPVGAQH